MPARRFSCPFCSDSAASESALRRHVRENHSVRVSRRGAVGPYLAHARSYGVEGVMEAALADFMENPRKFGKTPALRVKNLSYLAEGLRTLDARWRCPAALDRVGLWHDQGHDTATIARLLGVSASTVRSRIRALAEPVEAAA